MLVKRRGAVSVLTLNRPEVRNCIDAETAGLLSEAIQTFAAEAEASVLVVAGAGTDAFCSGADLKDIELWLTGMTGGVGSAGVLRPGAGQAADRRGGGVVHRRWDRAGLLV